MHVLKTQKSLLRLAAKETFMERGTGVEPASAAWEAAVLPMYEPCVSFIIAPSRRKIKGVFLSLSVSLCRYTIDVRLKRYRKKRLSTLE